MRLAAIPYRLALRIAYPIVLRWWRLRRVALRGTFVAVWHGDRVLLLRNSYRLAWSMPGGSVGRREGVLPAALRELREEVGLTLRPADLRYACTVVSHAFGIPDTVSFYEVEVAEPPAIAIDGREVIWAGFMPAADAAKLRLLSPVRLYFEERLARGGT